MKKSIRLGFENTCKGIVKNFADTMSWKWDDRFEAVLAEFASDQKERVGDALKEFFPFSWGSSDMREAPDRIKKIGNFLGGVFPGQMIFVAATDREPLLFCAWWPWGNDKTISIRIAPFSETHDEMEMDDLFAHFKSWFGV